MVVEFDNADKMSEVLHKHFHGISVENKPSINQMKLTEMEDTQKWRHVVGVAVSARADEGQGRSVVLFCPKVRMKMKGP